MLPLRTYIEHPKIFLTSLLREYGGWIPDKQYLQILYYLKMGKRLNLKNPQTFSEKMQWLKLYNRKPEYTIMVDKLAVKDYVAHIIGAGYVIPTLDVWERPEDIDFDRLPNKFVLKTTHGGGSSDVVICKDKTHFDRETAVEMLKRGMKKNIYKSLREWPYKNVPRRIIAEKYIEDWANLDGEMTDYKFYCFNGIPVYCQVIGNRHTTETIDFFDMDWVHQLFYGLNPLGGPFAFPAGITPSCPPHLDEMKNMAERLAINTLFCRIDLYDTTRQPYFGEYTLYPASGIGIFSPTEYNDILGRMIKMN